MTLNLGNLKTGLETPEPAASKETAAAADPVKYQHYKSSRASVRLISTAGRRITFINHQFVTCEQELIDYLDDEIAKGVPGITRGELLTREEADPMSAIKRKHFEEFKAMQEAERIAAAKGEEKDMGTTVSKPEVSPASTRKLGGNAAGSTSADAAGSN